MTGLIETVLYRCIAGKMDTILKELSELLSSKFERLYVIEGRTTPCSPVSYLHLWPRMTKVDSLLVGDFLPAFHAIIHSSNPPKVTLSVYSYHGRLLHHETLDVTGSLIFVVTENPWLTDLDQGSLRPCCGLSDAQLGEVLEAVTLSKDFRDGWLIEACSADSCLVRSRTCAVSHF